MSGRATAIILSVLLFASAAASAQVNSGGDRGDEPFAVGTLRTELVGTDKVGHRRAGLVCAPAGALLWREVGPAGAKASAAAARAIHDSGVAIDAPNVDDWLEHRAPSTGFRLIGDIVGVHATICAPAYGLARRASHGQHLKGEGRMRIDWRIYRLADHQVVARTETCAAFTFDRTGLDPPDVGQLGVIENARLLGAALARTPRRFEVPESLIAHDDSCPPRVRAHRTPDGAADLP